MACGNVTHPGVAEAFGFPHVPLELQPGAPAGEAPGVVRFQRLPSNPDLPLPGRATDGSAGHDIRSCEDVKLAPGGIHAIATGLVMELPAGVECQVRPRSGLAFRHGITLPNSPGTIDPDYRGELRVLVQNLGPEAVDIRRGDRIAQLVFSRFVVPEVEDATSVSPTGRGSGGFGSTGVN